MATPLSNHTADDHTAPGPYVGRFAPSPTGPLHFGSLVSALASYLDARHQSGIWLVRMENIDPPREQAGAQDAILRSLEDHALHWDGQVLFQSERLAAYAQTLAQLQQAQLVYPCRCRRKDIQAMGGVYDGRCRLNKVSTDKPHALRLKLYELPPGGPELPDQLAFEDLIQGPQQQDLRRQAGDQIVLRKDGLFAYQLAVVVDDIAQGITCVLRGSDLLEVTARQIRLFQLLGARVPAFGHVPVAVNPLGQKLSKQTHAPPLNRDRAGANLWRALDFLGQQPPPELQAAAPDELLTWGLAHWRRERIPGQSHLPAHREYL